MTSDQEGGQVQRISPTQTTLKNVLDPATNKKRANKVAVGTAVSRIPLPHNIGVKNDVTLARYRKRHGLGASAPRPRSTRSARAKCRRPELRSVLTPSTGVGIVHRLLITLGTEATSASPWGTRRRHSNVVDARTERIASPDIVTGVALHFDAPSSRAPQSLLLVVPPERESWSFDLVVDSLLETLEAAKLRAVDPDILIAHGHQMPAIFPAGSLAAGVQPVAD